MEIKWQEQERIGTDFIWGSSATFSMYEAVLQFYTAICCVNLYVFATVISFVPQVSRLRTI